MIAAVVCNQTRTSTNLIRLRSFHLDFHEIHATKIRSISACNIVIIVVLFAQSIYKSNNNSEQTMDKATRDVL